jgi:hypothetical protein
MNTADIQKQCETFLKSINVPAFIVLGFQGDPENVQMVYSLKDMQPKAVLKGLVHMVNDLMGKL